MSVPRYIGDGEFLVNVGKCRHANDAAMGAAASCAAATAIVAKV